MRPAIFANLALGPRQHVGSQIDSRDLAVRGVGRKRGARAGAHFQDFCAGRNVEFLYDRFQPRVKDLAENLIVKGGKFRIEFALVRLDLTQDVVLNWISAPRRRGYRCSRFC